MNLLFLATLYPKQELDEALRLTKDGIQYQGNNFQMAMLEGLKNQLKPTEALSILNVLPVGAYPSCYGKLILKRREYPEDSLTEIGCVNVPPLKQWGRAMGARRAITKWMKKSKENRTLLIFSQYTPYLKAYRHVKRAFPDAKACVIITDLPNEWGIDTGRRGLLKRLEARDGRQSLKLLEYVDGYVLLTEAMREVLPMEGKRYCVVEGLILPQPEISKEAPPEPIEGRKVALYTGTLNREFGVGTLVEAFRGDELNDCELWLCGRGDMEKDIEAAAADNPRIRYFGFQPLEKALAMQRAATLLINPRTNDGVFTRYSFPSKTLEYMRSGRPVLCHRLSGFPPEYDYYLVYIDGDKPSDTARAIRAMLDRGEAELTRIGERARDFALSHKNADSQTSRVVKLLRDM